MSHGDVKDASAGVLKDLKRFQGEKEEDLKRYMVGKCEFSAIFPITDTSNRLHSPNAISNGRAAARPLGKRRKQR